MITETKLYFGAASSLASCTLTDLVFILDIHVLKHLCDDKEFKREFTFSKCLTGLLGVFIEFLRSESDVEAAFVLLVFALVVECQARGPHSVARILYEVHRETGGTGLRVPQHPENTEEISVQFCLKFLRRFQFIRAILSIIRTRRQMINFALKMAMALGVLDSPEFHDESLKEELIEYTREMTDESYVFRRRADFLRNGGHQVFPFIVPKDDLLIDIMADSNRSFSFECIASSEPAPAFASSMIDVITSKTKPFYEDTMLRWFIQRSVGEELDGRIIGKKCVNLKSLDIRYACIKLEVNGIDTNYFLATVGNKTIEEVGYGDKLSYHVHYEKVFEVENPAPPVKSTKQGKSKQKCSNKSRSKGKSKRGPKAKHAISRDDDAATEMALRLAHSKSFEPVLNELKPLLREVREKISSRGLQRDEPKKRTVKKKKAAADKENEANYCPPPQSETKAGKAVHRILVGEPDYLYKPLSSRNSSQNGSHGRRVSILDLHGFSAEDARSKLEKCVGQWMKEAMVEYPFVIRVDIICGGGAQVLSDVVGEFIRHTPQVANRPKGLTMI